MTNLKQTILKESNNGLDFYFLVLGELEMVTANRCENTLNPFYEDSNPSFSVYLIDDDDRWRFKDYGECSYCGDVFDFAAIHYDLDIKKEFNKILSNMATDLKIKETNTIVNNISANTSSCVSGDLKIERWMMSSNYKLEYADENNGINVAFDYFKKYGITKNTLKRYNVGAVKSYQKLDWENQCVITNNLRRLDIVIAYDDLKFAKLYSPEPKRFWYLGNKEKDYVFGIRQIFNKLVKTKTNLPLIILTGGEKDVLTLASLGYDAISLNSETAQMPKILTENWLYAAKRIVILYDLDLTGKEMAQNRFEELKTKGFDVRIAELPKELKEVGGKDVSDYVKLGLSITELKNCISDSQVNNNENPVSPNSLQEYLENEPVDVESFNTPLIPESVYNLLPVFLKNICNHFEDPRDKDVVLSSSLAVLSSCFPKVKGYYGNMKVGANFNLFISAPPASGKGVMSWSKIIASKIQGSLTSKFQEETKEYEKLLVEYESNKGSGREKPTKPVFKALFIPANTSSSKLVQHLVENQNFGIMFATEGDTLSGAIKNEWGNFSDIVRGSFHHELVNLSRRAKDEYLTVEKPHLSLVLSGTPNQINTLIQSVENGFFSRFLFYDFDSPVKWRDQFGDGNNYVEKSFEEAAEYIKKLWVNQYTAEETSIKFNAEQIKIINQTFESRLLSLHFEHGDDIDASIKRFCLVLYRIAMVLTVLKWHEKMDVLPSEIFIADDEFKVAMEIINVLVVHLERVFQRLSSQKTTSVLNPQQKKLFEVLPKHFFTKEFEGLRETVDIKNAAGQKYLSDYIKKGILERIAQGEYRKVA